MPSPLFRCTCVCVAFVFLQCDSDGSGGISIEEYVHFCSREGIARSMAETTFFQADIDGNGTKTEDRNRIPPPSPMVM